MESDKVREYIVYKTPINTILLDWNNALWKYGYPYFPKSVCTEIERGTCEGGKFLGKFYAELKKKYNADITSEEEVERVHKWEMERLDKLVAKCHLNNFGKIYLDEYGCPIDNEAAFEKLAEKR